MTIPKICSTVGLGLLFITLFMSGLLAHAFGPPRKYYVSLDKVVKRSNAAFTASILSVEGRETEHATVRSFKVRPIKSVFGPFPSQKVVACSYQKKKPDPWGGVVRGRDGKIIGRRAPVNIYITGSGLEFSVKPGDEVILLLGSEVVPGKEAKVLRLEKPDAGEYIAGLYTHYKQPSGSDEPDKAPESSTTPETGARGKGGSAVRQTDGQITISTDLKFLPSLAGDPERVYISTMLSGVGYPFKTLYRVEFSIRDDRSNEYFRAMFNSCTWTVRICDEDWNLGPGGFGAFPVGEKETLSVRDVRTFPHVFDGPNKPLVGKYVTFLSDARYKTRENILELLWPLELSNLPAGTYGLWGMIVRKRDRKEVPGAVWLRWATLVNPQESETDTAESQYERLMTRVQGLTVRKRGVEALQELHKIYALKDAQVSYKKVGQARARALKILGFTRTFMLGDEEYKMRNLSRVFFRDLLPKPDILERRVIMDGTFPFDRYLYLNIVAGRTHKKKLHPVFAYLSPELDLDRCLESRDPWVVSSALYMARKGYAGLDPQTVVTRWESPGAFWDEVCTQQAVLYMARQSAEAIKGLEIKNSAVKEALEMLKDPLPNECQVQVVFADETVQKKGRPPVRVLKNEATVKARSCGEGTLCVPPGRYQIETPAGNSRTFTAKPGRFVRVVIP